MQIQNVTHTDPRTKFNDKTVEVIVKNITSFQTKSGATCISIRTFDNECFSNFIWVWRANKLDIDNFKAGDKMIIHFVENGPYKNFGTVEISDNAHIVSNIENTVDNEIPEAFDINEDKSVNVVIKDAINDFRQMPLTKLLRINQEIIGKNKMLSAICAVLSDICIDMENRLVAIEKLIDDNNIKEQHYDRKRVD